MSCRTNRLLLTHWFPASSAEKCVWRQNSWVLLTGGAVWTSLWLSSNGPRCDRETGDLIGHRAGGTAHPLGLWAIFERVYNYLKSFFATTPCTLVFRMPLDWRLCRKMQVFWLLCTIRPSWMFAEAKRSLIISPPSPRLPWIPVSANGLNPLIVARLPMVLLHACGFKAEVILRTLYFSTMEDAISFNNKGCNMFWFMCEVIEVHFWCSLFRGFRLSLSYLMVQLEPWPKARDQK